MKSCSLTGRDTKVSFENLEAENKKIIDPESDRYFFVSNPIKLKITEIPKNTKVKIHFHPDYPKKGSREFILEKETENFLITSKDADKMEMDTVARLKDLFNIEIKEVKEDVVYAEYSKDQRLESARQKIQWVIQDSSIKTKILMPDASAVEGFSESHCAKLKPDNIIQFQRFGFCRLEKKNPKELFFIFTHT